MAITGHNQNASGSDPACLVGFAGGGGFLLLSFLLATLFSGDHFFDIFVPLEGNCWWGLKTVAAGYVCLCLRGTDPILL